jgi:thymidylate synthase (FAD)
MALSTCARKVYQRLLKDGLAREVARNVLPLGTMTRFYATISLRNWLGFLTLRNHPAALLEIRREAEALEELLHTLWPVTMRVWTDEGRPSL